MVTVYIGIGSNLGDRRANCIEAVRRIQELSSVKMGPISTLYETDPVGGPPQPRYFNGVICLKTDIGARELLLKLKGIETIMGRAGNPLKDHPRVIDLDILLYGDYIIQAEDITVPHPRMHERFFVLKGLSEISPDVMHPILKKTAIELLRRADKGKLT